MEKETKIWVVSSRNSGFLMYSSVAAVFLSKRDADFFIWEKNAEQNKKRSYGDIVYGYIHYSTEEVEVISQEKSGKNWNNFCKDRRKELEREIEANKNHSAGDLARVASLKREMETY